MVKRLRARLHRLVGNEPRVAGAAPVGAVLPAGNVGLVLVGHADGEAVHLHIAGPGEMEYRLMIVVEVAAAGDRLEMADGVLANADGFHPGDVVLEHEDVAEGTRHVHRDPRIAAGAADIEKKGRSEERRVGKEWVCTCRS